VITIHVCVCIYISYDVLFIHKVIPFLVFSYSFYLSIQQYIIMKIVQVVYLALLNIKI